MRSQNAEFVLQVRADAARAREDIARLRQEEEARAMHVRVHTDTGRATEQVDRMRVEQEARAIHLRVDVDESAHSRLSAAVSRASRQAEEAAEKLAQAEQRVNDIRRQRAEEINPLLTAAENALERARRSGNTDAIARSERNLSEMRKALGSDTQELARAEAAAASARRHAASASENLQRAIDNEINKSRDLSRELGSLQKDFENAFQISHFADAFSSAAGWIGMLPAMATGLAGVAQAAQQLAGASLALPGAFAGVGASLGTLLVGINGVTNAYKALGREATDSANDQRQHAIEVRQANDELAAATREESEAERERARAVRDSRQEMEDLNLQLRGGKLDTEQAILDAQQARRDLVTGHYRDGLDYEQAILRVKQADLRVQESLSNQNKLRNRAADVGDRVAQANNRVALASQRVARAQEHVNDVNTKLSASQRAVNAAMAKLAPNAQEFVRTIFELTRSGALHELRMEDQQNLFAGMSTSIRTLVGSDLPVLRAGMGSVASSLNSDFKELFSSLGSDHSKGFIGRIFGDTAHAQDVAKNAIDPLVSAVGTLARAGADTLPRMADGLARATDRFNAFIKASDKDGRLDSWINAGITGFSHLGDIFIHLGQSVSAVSKALGGRGLLAELDDATKHLSAFLNSAKGQDDLRKLFADGRHELEQLRPILEALPAIFKSAFDAARDSVSGWLPLLQTVSTLLKDFPGLTQGILEGFLAWKSIGPVVSVVGDGIGLLARGLGSVQTEITNSRVLAGTEMSKTARIFQKVAGEEGVGRLTGALNTLSGIGGPVGMMAVTAAVPIVVAALNNLNRSTQEAAQAAQQLDQQERTLEDTLDRVSGKITASTRQQAIDAATNFSQAGAGGSTPGGPFGLWGGHPLKGISSGNAIQAATKLGIPPDVYVNALMGDPAATKQVEDVISKNNLLPELQANAALRSDLGTLAGAGLSPQDLVSALIGAPGAVEKYIQALKSHGMGDPTGSGLDLTHIAQQLSPTGQASVLSGLALTHQQAVTAGAQNSQQQKQQADFGRWRLSGQGQQDLGLPANTQVNASDDGYHISVPGISDALNDKLKQQNITPQKNYDGSYTFVLPKGSPDVEHYEKGGGTPHAPGPLPDGGRMAVIHPSEWISNKTGRNLLGDDFLAAANQNRLDLSLLPHFSGGGGGETDGDELGPTGAPPAGAGGVLPAVQQTISGAQGTLNTGMNLFNSFTQGAGLRGPGIGGMGMGMGMGARGVSPFVGMPGLWGLIGVAQSPNPGAAMQAWGGQTLNWLANWGGNTLGQLGSIFYQGILSGFGLDKSILSPSNIYTRDAMQVGSQIFQRFGGASLLGGMFGGGNPMLGSVDPSLVGALGNRAIPGVGGAAAPGGEVIGENPESRAASLFAGRAPGDVTPELLQRAGFQPLYNWGPGSTAAGNVPGWVQNLASQFGLVASTYNKGDTLHHGGFAWDFNDPDAAKGANSPKLDAFANFVQQHLGDQTLQLIHADPQTGQKWGIAAGQDVGPGTQSPGYYRKDWADHYNHVHWATDAPVLINPSGGITSSAMPGVLGAPGAGMAGSAVPGSVNPAALTKGQTWWNGWTPGSASAGLPGASGMGSTQLQNLAHALYLRAGMPPDEWSDFQQLISHESGWNPNAQNPGSSAYGLGQFLDSTWASVGGSKTSDPARQLEYIFQYLKQRKDYHGSPAAAWSLWQSRSPHWYDSGGDWPTGTVGFNMSGKTETVLNSEQTQSVHQALTTAAEHINSATSPRSPTAQHMQPRAMSPAQGAHALPELPQPTTAAPGGAPRGRPAPPAALGPLGPQAQPVLGAPTVHGSGPQHPQGAWGPDSGMHVMPALKTGIMSTANTLGGLAAMAINMGAMAASMGANGAAPGAGTAAGAGLSSLGGFVQGLFNEGGKIAVDIANIPSSLMVGTLSPGTTANPSGQTYHPRQETPAVARGYGRNTTYNISGTYELDAAIDAMKLHESQEQQSHLANYRA